MKYIVGLLFCLFAVLPQPASARDHVSLSFGFGCCGPWPYADPFWPGPMIYAPPPAVIFAPMRPVYRPVETIYVPAPAPAALPADQISPTFIDARGRTCRHFETMMGGDPVRGTACLYADGTWRTVE